MLWLLLIHEEEWNNHSSSWMSNIQCISLPHLIYAVICGWTFRLFPCLFQVFFLKFLKFLMSSVVQLLSRVWLFVTTWTAACQAPLSIGFPGKNTGVGWYFLLQGIFLGQGSNLRILHWQVDFFSTTELSGKPICLIIFLLIQILSYTIDFLDTII